MELHNIFKVESTIHGVKITLVSGVVLDISSYRGYFYFNFNGTKLPIKVSTSRLEPDFNKDILQVGNLMDIEYKPNKE